MAFDTHCKHANVSCINHYEWIRKYRCADCGGVMLCACDEEFGRRCLPHQLGRARVEGIDQSIPVTLGFAPGICNACRGIAEEPHPAAPSHGRTNKVARFYWREINCETLSRFDAWARSRGLPSWIEAAAEYESIREDIGREVLAEIKALHERAPKYSLKEDSQDDVIRRHNVETVALRGVHVSGPDGLRILDGTEPHEPEEYAARHFRNRGYRTLFVESRPIHVLFGVFVWMLIEDPDDPLAQPSGFGDRHAFDRGQKGPMVWITLPADFGSPAYAARRASAVDEHFDFVGRGKDQLCGLFDYWLEPSERLRQYLWAHRKPDVDRAHALLEAMPPDQVLAILRFLLDDYWGRYLGWPDLLCHQEESYFFAEVKSSRDKLSHHQKEWIALNARHLQLPFKLVKIHRVDQK